VDQAIAVNPNLSDAWRIRGWISFWLGQHEQALEQFQYAMRLNPLDPRSYAAENGLAMANFCLHRFEIALSWATKSMARQKNYAPPVRCALASYAMLGRIADAQTMYDRLRHAGAELTISQIRMRNPCKLQEDVELFIEGHRRTGVPE
jgi:adenylate cyclase